MLRSALLHHTDLNQLSRNSLTSDWPFLLPVSAAAHTGAEARPALRPRGQPGRTQIPNQPTDNTCNFPAYSCLSQLSETTVPTLEPSSFILGPSQMDGPPSLDIRSALRCGMKRARVAWSCTSYVCCYRPSLETKFTAEAGRCTAGFVPDVQEIRVR